MKARVRASAMKPALNTVMNSRKFRLVKLIVPPAEMLARLRNRARKAKFGAEDNHDFGDFPPPR